MKTKKIFVCLILLFGMVIAFNTNVNAETLPDISDVVNSIEPYNNDGTSYPDLRNRDMTVTIYAYINPNV